MRMYNGEFERGVKSGKLKEKNRHVITFDCSIV
jgi:hypothetical protein